jgi:hypothetical protein
MAELMRTKGELLFIQGEQLAAAAAEDFFLRGALYVARRQSELSWRLQISKRQRASSPSCEAVATDVIVKWWPLKPASSLCSRGLAHRQFGRSLPWRADSRAENGENPQHSRRALGSSRAL